MFFATSADDGKPVSPGRPKMMGTSIQSVCGSGAGKESAGKPALLNTRKSP